MIRKRKNDDGETRIFEGLKHDASPEEERRFKKEAQAAIFRMSAEAAEALAENDQPFMVVIAGKQRTYAHIGMAGSKEDAKRLYNSVEQAQEELMKNIMASELGITPDKLEKLKRLMEED